MPFVTMEIISGDSLPFHHFVTRGRTYRSVAKRFLTSTLPLNEVCKQFAKEQVQQVSECSHGYSLAPGVVDTAYGLDPQPAVSRLPEILDALAVKAALPSAFSTQMLICPTAYFHHDLHGWDNCLFLNWYMAGPERDFVLAGVGRVTIRPGDIILFDPSRPHSLLKPSAAKFTKAGLSANNPDDLSLFLSADIALTPELDALFGIERGPKSVFDQASSIDIENLKVNKYTGDVYPYPASKKKLAA